MIGNKVGRSDCYQQHIVEYNSGGYYYKKTTTVYDPKSQHKNSICSLPYVYPSKILSDQNKVHRSELSRNEVRRSDAVITHHKNNTLKREGIVPIIRNR